MSIDLAEIMRSTCVRSGEWLPQAESTNTLALQRITSLLELPCLLGADRQTRGRGRSENTWWAGEGALTFSLVIEPLAWGIPQQRWPLLSLITGLALCQAVDRWIPRPATRLKWPNDLYLEGRKLAGILIESASPSPARLVIGIGLNVNNSLQHAPAEVKARAVSLCEFREAEIPLQDVLVDILRELEQQWQRLRNPAETERLLEECRRRCLLTGRTVSIQLPTEIVTGFCAGIEADGGLLLTTEAGPRRFHAGTVIEWSREE